MIAFQFVSGAVLVAECSDDSDASVPVDGINYNLNTANHTASVEGLVTSWGVKTVDIPPSIIVDQVQYAVTSIESYAFAWGSYQFVTLPDTITSIGSSAFRGCTTLNSINIPSSVISIGNDAFKDIAFYLNGSLVSPTPQNLAGKTWTGSGDGKLYYPSPTPTTTYTITFDANGGTPTTQTRTTGTDGRLADLPSVSRSGYSFDGWYTTASGGTQISTQTIFTKDDTVYAHWTQGPSPTGVYTITFNATGGSCSVITAKTGTDGKLSSLPTAAKAGQDFDGWYTSASGGTKITTSTIFSNDSTIYAHWKQGPTPEPSSGTTAGAAIVAIIGVIAALGIGYYIFIRKR